jgi:putative ABC transport system substrate-binding protein
VALTGKRLGLLHDLVPSATRFAFLANPNSSSAQSQIADAQAAAAATASTNEQIGSAFERIVRSRAEALLIGAGPYSEPRRAILPRSRRATLCRRSITFASMP